MTKDGTTPRTIVIVDPARRAGSKIDRMFSDRLARAFHADGWTVKWAIELDDDLPSCAYASIHRILPILRIATKAMAMRAPDDAFAPASSNPTLTGPPPRPTVGSDDERSADGPKEDLSGLLRQCGSVDLIVFPAAETVHLEMLLELLPELEIRAPLPTTLHMRFTSVPRLLAQAGELDAQTIATRLASGSPVRSLVFHADTPEAAARYEKEIGLPVRVIETDARQCLADVPDAALPALFCSYQGTNEGNGRSNRPSLVIEKLGPIVLLVSALWGRVGSTQIFDAQTRYLVAKGYIVVRIFIEHWPHHGQTRIDRIATFTAENFKHIRPHSYFIAERNETHDHVQQLSAEPEFQAASPVRRIQRLLAKPVVERPRALVWCANNATMAIVNHLPHVAFAEQLTQAPIVLETHDVYSQLLDSHGIPGFIPKGPDDHDLRMAEERETWARVAACVNLSPEDHEHVAKVARFSVLVRPYVMRRQHCRRSWLEVLAENRMNPVFRTANSFDLMLWGSPHDGNARSITWFLEEVVTAHKVLQSARILLIGRVTEALDQALIRRNNVLIAGFVDKIDDFAFRTKVLVIPDQGGTGISIKAMDSFALGACFATTNFGVRGIDMGDTGYVPAFDAADLGTDIVRLLGSASARRERADLARRLYDLNFSADAYVQAWDSVVAEVADIRYPRATPAGANAGHGITRAPVSAAFRPNRAQPAGASNQGKLADDVAPLEKPRLTAVVCTYDRYDVLPDALASLLSQDCVPGFLEIIVVDNSPDQTAAAAFAAQYREENRLRYLLEPIPGLSNARNVGMREAGADLIAFIDDDAIAAPRWAQEIVRTFELHGRRAAVVGGRIVPRWVTPPPTWFSKSLLDYLSIVDWGEKTRELKSSEWLAGCNIAFDKEALTLAGGFSRALGRIGSQMSLLSNEEVEVMEKINATGRVSIYTPAATVEHVIDPGRLTREWFRRRAAWQAVSDFIKDSKRAILHAPVASKHLRWLLESSTLRAPPGFYVATDDAEEFKHDMTITYDLVIATLSGGVDIDIAKTRSPLSCCLSQMAKLAALEHPSKDAAIALICDILRDTQGSSYKGSVYHVLDRLRECAGHAITDRDAYTRLTRSFPVSLLLEYYTERLRDEC